MKRVLIALCCILFSTHAMAGGGRDSFLSMLNAQAKSDLTRYSAKISAQFGVPEAQVKVAISTVKEPADAFMVFQLRQMAARHGSFNRTWLSRCMPPQPRTIGAAAAVSALFTFESGQG